MTGSILVLNAGSSSLKFALFPSVSTGETIGATARGQVEDLQTAPHLSAVDSAGHAIADQIWPPGLPDPFATVLDALLTFAGDHLEQSGLVAVGHRIVHGGEAHVGPARVTEPLMRDLEALVSLDPLHMPHNLAPIGAVAALRPNLPQIVCFDTAFHHTLPVVARMFALPRSLTASGLRRYGFHGLSYEWIAGQLTEAPVLAGRVVVAHLGAGASLCALRDGRSVATTMGFSTLDGLVMATRCGSIDPGIILHLLRQGHSPADIEDLLYHRSGMLGVSGLSGDVRTLLASEDPDARLALDLFTDRIAIEAAGLVSALSGLDGLVFTAGIGEHAPWVRTAVCARLAWLGIELDPSANASGAARISTEQSRIDVRVIPTDEEAVIARHTMTMLSEDPRTLEGQGPVAARR
jgi:acetate kinase